LAEALNLLRVRPRSWQRRLKVDLLKSKPPWITCEVKSQKALAEPHFGESHSL
jgi:hypothetical protein